MTRLPNDRDPGQGLISTRRALVSDQRTPVGNSDMAVPIALIRGPIDELSVSQSKRGVVLGFGLTEFSFG